jgi:hypothetical protein
MKTLYYIGRTYVETQARECIKEGKIGYCISLWIPLPTNDEQDAIKKFLGKNEICIRWIDSTGNGDTNYSILLNKETIDIETKKIIDFLNNLGFEKSNN